MSLPQRQALHLDDVHAAAPSRTPELCKPDWDVLQMISFGKIAELATLGTQAPPLRKNRPYTYVGALERYRAGEEVLARAAGTASAGPATSRSSVALLRNPGARRLTIVFAGNHAQFIIPSPLLTAHDTHLLMVRDPRRCFALAGLEGLGGDYRACVARLGDIIRILGVDEVRCIGMSAGGVPALKFGCDLGTSGVLGFSIPTTLNLEDRPGSELKHFPQLAMLYKLDRSLGIDFAAYYRAAATRPRTTLIYSAGHIRDAWLTGRMGGCEGVTLLDTVGFIGHGTYRWAVAEGLLPAILDNFYEPGSYAVPAPLKPAYPN